VVQCLYEADEVCWDFSLRKKAPEEEAAGRDIRIINGVQRVNGEQLLLVSFNI